MEHLVKMPLSRRQDGSLRNAAAMSRVDAPFPANSILSIERLMRCDIRILVPEELASLS